MTSGTMAMPSGSTSNEWRGLNKPRKDWRMNRRRSGRREEWSTVKPFYFPHLYFKSYFKIYKKVHVFSGLDQFLTANPLSSIGPTPKKENKKNDGDSNSNHATVPDPQGNCLIFLKNYYTFFAVPN